MMHAPAAGRAIAELILDGALHDRSTSRASATGACVEHRPYAERGIL